MLMPMLILMLMRMRMLMLMLIVGADCLFPGFPVSAKVKPGIIYLQFALALVFAFTFTFALTFRHRTSIYNRYEFGVTRSDI